MVNKATDIQRRSFYPLCVCVCVPDLQAQTQAHLVRAVKTLKWENSAGKSFLAHRRPRNLFIFSIDLFSCHSTISAPDLKIEQAALVFRFEFGSSVFWLFSSTLVWVTGGRYGTWDGLWLWRSPEGHGCWLRLALLILCHHIDVVLCVPL